MQNSSPTANGRSISPAISATAIAASCGPANPVSNLTRYAGCPDQHARQIYAGDLKFVPIDNKKAADRNKRSTPPAALTFSKEIQQFTVNLLSVCPCYAVWPILYHQQAGSFDQLGGPESRSRYGHNPVRIAVNDQR